MMKRIAFIAMRNMDLPRKSGSCARSVNCGHTRNAQTWRMCWRNLHVICAGVKNSDTINCVLE